LGTPKVVWGKQVKDTHPQGIGDIPITVAVDKTFLLDDKT